MSTTPTRSGVMAFKEETTEGTLIDPVAADFVPMRDGFTFQGEIEALDSDEMIDDIGSTKSFTAKEVPKGSFPKYLRHSGIEGTAPEYAVLIKSAMGTQTDNSTERDTVSGSVAGTSAIRGKVVVDSGEGAGFVKGQALLIKDGVNGHEIRNVFTISTDDLNLNFNLPSAPGVGVNLGKANHFSPASDGHITYSAHHYGQSSASDYRQAQSGCRTISMGMDFPANGFAEISFDFEGTKYYTNQIRIDATNNKINFIDNVSELTATLENRVYDNPLDLAAEVASKMTAASAPSQADTISVAFSSSTGKYTISSGGSTLELDWKTGTNGADNTDTHAGTVLGYSDAADDTGALTYTADNAQDYSPGSNGGDSSSSVTPSYDDSDNIILKDCELLIGNFDNITSRKTISASCTIGTPKTDVPDLTAENGIDCSIVNSREVVFNAVIVLEKHEAFLFDSFINNTTRSIMFNAGPRSAGNWVAGKCFNLYMANASITALTNDDNDGYRVFNLEARGHVDESQKDVHINFI